jgi:hypothetical protein
MEALVVIAGLLALTSGLLKLFGKGRRGAGFSPWALLEVLAGIVCPLYALQGGRSPGVLAGILFLTLALILLSSVLRVREARARQKRREDTESARLEVYVKYLSRFP